MGPCCMQLRNGDSMCGLDNIPGGYMCSYTTRLNSVNCGACLYALEEADYWAEFDKENR